MSRTKVMTIVGTRPEIIRMSQIIRVFDRHFDHHLVHTGQNFDFELNEIFFSSLNIRKPDIFLAAAGSSPVETIAKILVAIDPVLARDKPQAVVILGDTNSCLAAYAAKRRKIPIFHLEAGNRCGDQRVPEEINRRIVDHLSDVNLPYSERSRENLIAEGLPPDRVLKIGSPMKEVITAHLAAAEASGIVQSLGLQSRQFYVASIHREENVDQHVLVRLVASLNAIAESKKRPIIFSCHPRTAKAISEAGISVSSEVRMLKPLGFIDYLKLQMEAAAVLSDSGTISEEASILNFPAINLREAHERMEAMEEGSVVMTGTSHERIMEGLAIVEAQPRGPDRLLKLPRDYDVDNVSEKVARIVISYIDVVNRKVWSKRS